MAILNGQPFTRQIIYTYADGHQTTVTPAPLATKYEYARIKDAEITPGFTPGKFLIKPYRVSSTICKGQAQNLRTVFTKGDVTTSDTLTLTEHCHNNAFNGAVRSPPDVTAQINLALQEAFAKVDEAQWDVLVDLAEIGETAAMLKSLFGALLHPSRIPKFLDSLDELYRRNKRFKRGKATVRQLAELTGKGAADAQLLWRYGIMPFILSIQDALKTLKGQLAKASSDIKTCRRRPEPTVLEWSKQGSTLTGANYTYKWTSRIEAIVYYQRTLDQSLKRALGLCPENLPSVFWEATRLSFVWDWFFHVGTFLAAVKPKVGITVLGSSTSLKQVGDIAIIQLLKLSDAKYQAAKPFTIHIESFERTVNNGGFIPTFTGLDSMTIPRWIDSAALSLKPILRLLKKRR